MDRIHGMPTWDFHGGTCVIRSTGRKFSAGKAHAQLTLVVPSVFATERKMEVMWHQWGFLAEKSTLFLNPYIRALPFHFFLWFDLKTSKTYNSVAEFTSWVPGYFPFTPDHQWSSDHQWGICLLQQSSTVCCFPISMDLRVFICCWPVLSCFLGSCLLCFLFNLLHSF